jgi:DNA-binding transcriptional MerR regulator
MDGFDRANFDLWNYTGEVNAGDLEALGHEVDDEQRLSKISAVVTMCNGKVIKAILNPMDSGDLPYDMFQWDTIEDSPWGVGIPYLMRYAQRSLNAAWRQMQDNAGVSHGPQIVINRRLIEPHNKDWTITGMKLWQVKAEASIEDVSKAFQVFQINSNQPQLESIINLCLKFIDDETAVPMLAQGEKGTAPDKVGIVSMLMNASNVVLKRLARNWDAKVTNPQIRRYYDFNMQYSEKPDIKGEYNVHALGSTNLVVRDQQKQDIQNLMAMSQQPPYDKFVNPKKVMEIAWKMSSVPDVLYTDNELKEMEAQAAKTQPPMDPVIEVAKIRAEAAVAAEKVEAESERVNQELRMEEAKRNDEREIYKMELMRDLEMLKQANAQGMQLAEIKAQLAGKVMDIKAQTVKETSKVQNDQVKADKQIASNHAMEDQKARNARVLEGQKALNGAFSNPRPQAKKRPPA